MPTSIPTGALPTNWPKSHKAAVHVKVTKWPELRDPASTFLTRLKPQDNSSLPPVPDTIARLIFELIQLKELPRRFTLALAWACMDNHLKGTGRQELVIYDCAQWDRQIILHGMFAENVGVLADLVQIGENIGHGLPPGLQRAGVLHHDISVTQYRQIPDKHELIITIVDTMRCLRYPLGEYCRAIPIPPFGENGKTNPRMAVVAASYGTHGFTRDRDIWATLEIINRVVRNPKSIVLLRGSPGAGKELYAQAVHRLTGHLPTKELHAISTAGLTLTVLQEYLTGSMTPEGYHISGRIAEAEGSTLMLDEFDKACAGELEQRTFYSWLLRVLEAREYWPRGANKAVKYEKVAWVFAGAFTNVQSFPPDFWSRLSNDVPLPDFNATTEYVTAMFLYWWFGAVLGIAGNIEPGELVNDRRGDFAIMLVRRLLLDGDISALKPAAEAVRLAQEFSKEVSRAIRPEWPLLLGRRKPISARTIREAARAAAESMLFDAKGLGTDNAWKEATKACKAAMGVVRLNTRGAC